MEAEHFGGKTHHLGFNGDQPTSGLMMFNGDFPWDLWWFNGI